MDGEDIAGLALLGAGLSLGYWAFAGPALRITSFSPFAQDGPGPDTRTVITASLRGGVMIGATLRQAFIASGKFHPPPSDLSTCRQIPIVNPNRTIWSNLQRNGGRGNSGEVCWSKPAFIDWLAQARTFLAAAGRGSEDVRCSTARWCIESGWGTNCWNYNLGNIKARPFATADTISAGYVYTQSTWAQELYILKDNDQSIDGYYGYPDFGTYCGAEAAVFQNHYQGCLEAFQQGELAGLLAGGAIQIRNGYKDSTIAGDAHELTNVWQSSLFGGLSVCGTDGWIR